jgi:zinc transport system substrate-binding protein
MDKRRSIAKIVTFALICAFATRSGAGLFAAGTQAVPTVAVSVLPQAEFVSRIAGDKVKVLVLVGPGASPHSYEPTPRQMAELSQASIWFSIGVEFENGLLPKVKALYPKLSIVNTAKNVLFRTLESHSDAIGPGTPAPAATNPPAAGAASAADSGGIDPHVWLGYAAVKVQLTAITDALCALKPADAPLFKQNLVVYLSEIDSVFAGLAKELAPLKGKTVFVYHPSFGYFLDTFGIKQEAVEVGGKEPTQKTLAALIQAARKDGAKAIFVQKQFSTNAAKAVAAAIGGVVVEIDPLAPNWLENVKVIGDALKSATAK